MTYKKGESFTNTLVFKILLVVVGGVIVWLFSNNNLASFTAKNNSKALSTSSNCSETESIEKAKKAIVKIQSDHGSGTGFLFDGPNEEKFILTNYHVVKDIESPRIIYFDKSPALGKLFNWDEETDLAVIKIERVDIPGLEFGESENLESGQNLIGIGFPFGSVLPGDATISKGTLSAKREANSEGVEYLQVDASINPGNSGGPVIDQCGKVMGIITLSISEAQGLNFAISSKTARTMVGSLILTGPKEVEENKLKIADNSTLVKRVFDYYDYISTRQLDSAFELLSARMQREVGGRENFIKGFDTTLNVFLQEVNPLEQNTVFVKLFSVDLVGDKVLFRSFSGTWKLSETDGIWKLDEANIGED